MRKAMAARLAGPAGGAELAWTGRIPFAFPPVSRFPARAPVVALLIIGFVGVRLHELVPLVSALKPVFLVSLIGAAYLFFESPESVRRTVLHGSLPRLVLLFYLWCLLTIPFALWPGGAFQATKGLLPAILMFFACAFVAPHRRNLELMQVGFVGLVLAYAAYAQLTSHTFLGRMLAPQGSFDSNDMAAVMAMTFPLAVGLAVRATPGRSRTIAGTAVVVTLLTAVASGSRGGILALIAGVIVFAFGQKGMRGVLTIVGLVAGLSVAWVTSSQYFKDRMLTIRDLSSDYNYTDDMGRKAVWRRARGYILENPVVGVGIGNFGVAEGDRLTQAGRRGKWSAAHNAYLQAGAELGVFGGALYILMLVASARYAHKLWRVGSSGRSPPDRLDRPEFLASLVAFSVGAYFLSHTYFPPLYAALGMISLAQRTAWAEALQTKMSPARSATAARPVGERGGLAFLPARTGKDSTSKHA